MLKQQLTLNSQSIYCLDSWCVVQHTFTFESLFCCQDVQHSFQATGCFPNSYITYSRDSSKRGINPATMVGGEREMDSIEAMARR